jgi:shikimate kinase
MPERARDEPRRIVLVGFMGSGKSSVGAELAALLGWSFVDLDGLIEGRTGRKIAAIFEEAGEPAFRAEERRAAAEAVAHERRVIAAGGGAFADPETRALLQDRSTTVYLECDLDTMLRRVPADGSRPLAGNRETMRRLFLAREASYRSADVSVDAARGTPSELALKIARLLDVPVPRKEPLA